MIPVQKLGWMAGLIDIRGRIVVKNNKTRATRQYVLAISSKEMYLIRELASLTGTKPEIRTERQTPDWMRRGCQEHCPDAHIHVSYQPSFPLAAVWSVTGSSMATVLYNVMPYLLSDRGYEAAYQYSLENAPLVGQGSGMVLGSLRRLRELGWELPGKFQEVLEKVDVEQSVL